jgi:hypothetical protein
MLRRIWNWLLGKPAESKKKTMKDEPSTPDNVIDGQKKLINLIVKHFGYSYGKEVFTETFVIWIGNNNPQGQSLVRETDFEKSLRTELENCQLWAASKMKITFKTENPPQNAGFLELKDDSTADVFIQRVEKPTETVQTKAKISILNDKGSLAKKEYRLDAAKQTEYNIGRGENNYNHIVILENDINNKENDFVSHGHAKILFEEKKGFFLQSRNENNRTIVNRNNQRFADIPNTTIKILLKNNDEIELGKAVGLLFEIMD